MDALIFLFHILFWLFPLLFVCFLIQSFLDKGGKTGDDAVSGSSDAQGLVARSKDGQYVYESSGCLALLAGLLLGFIAPVLVLSLLFFK